MGATQIQSVTCHAIMGVYAINATLQIWIFNSLRKEGNKMRRTVWEKMNEEERQLVLDDVWNGFDDYYEV